ncbi:MAG TPA: toll/interleukin-1 receptor domain-containing protein, partial [Pyrinomonadaceae bacterium]|nr:toll/interleukin-1 receptor domain-containing protein [Pyrinomonadaceae bacterium]
MEIPVRPVVLISYSHQDEIWKDRLKTQLRVLEKQGRLTLWEDRRISAGGDWYREIKSAIEAADVAVLLISADFLTSDFIQNEEVSRLLRRREEGGLRIFPVIVNSCPWREVAWLRSLQVSPKDGKPLSKYGGDRLNEVLSEIATRCLGHAVAPGVAPAPPNSAPAPKVSIGALASPEHKLFGRERELELLDEVWDDRDTNIFVLVAMGGVGKSSLIKHWLDRMAREGYRGAERVYEWSFYSQGTTDQAVSADLFIDSALRWFGDANPAQGSPRDKGERLAELIRRERTLLILDGLEPLQYPPGRQEGRLKDPTLRVLLRALAGENPGLCVINTRLRVSDLESFGEEEVSQFDLDPLSKQAGAQLLKALGVNGDEAELEQAAEEFKGHSLALLLLGSYLRYAFDDAHIRHRNEVENLEKEARYGEHAQHVMASYEKWFGEGPEVAVLRMLGLFKRPADAGALAALREQPPIPGLTDALQPLSEQQWNLLIAELRRAKLLAERDYRAAGVLDAHPLIREHFGRQLKQERPVAWREGNKRLYQHLKSTTRKYPETLAEMAPLYAAVAHGCEADLHHEALTEVYRARILRENQFFSTSKLGAFSAELATLANFFERPWMRPVGNLGEASRAFVLHEAGFDLRALGRLVEAAQPMRASLGAYISQEDWNTATVNAGQLSHIYLVIGELDKALKYARLCVTLADLSGDDFWRPRQRAALAKTLHYMGRLAEAEEIFGEAEEMQKRLEPRRPQLYALWGHFYCDLLLSLGRYRDAQSRASRSLQWIKAKDWMLMLATDHLSLGRAYMLRARREGRHHLRSAEKHLKNAVDKLRQAGRLDHLPRG